MYMVSVVVVQNLQADAVDRNRRCFAGAMVLGNEVLLGSIPTEDMDLFLCPQLPSVDVNPERPSIPLSLAM